MRVRVLADLGEGDPLHHPGGADDPEDAERRLPAGGLDVEEDEAPQQHDAAGALDGARVPAHPDLVHLLAEELHQEHPRQDHQGAQRELAGAGACGGGAGVLGLGEEVGHDGEQERERRGEEEADLGVEGGADVGETAEEVEVEEEAGEDEHDDGGGHHAGLVALLGVGRREVLDVHVNGGRAEEDCCLVIAEVNHLRSSCTKRLLLLPGSDHTHKLEIRFLRNTLHSYYNRKLVWFGRWSLCTPLV
ncbi:hypothetical protein PAHAL_4G346800 [Panicum hallii]|uniref:Uncharacterized protein n=1 Tax=Panicum hallii TaxID=206008 RepID=A0A2T8JF11_9POAL|nr:hypothetical protein PAHAL_4G346800 [Panicum hallii]